LICYWGIPKKHGNKFLLAASLVFYAWGDPQHIVFLLECIALNYIFGILIRRYKSSIYSTAILWISIFSNVAILVLFKYAAFLENIYDSIFINTGYASIPLDADPIPIGISFLTFQLISYLVDIYREEIETERNLLNFAMFVSFFPKLIAGPIVRYKDTAEDLVNRSVNMKGFSYGIKRFIVGLGKKILIAGTLEKTADLVMGIPFDQLGAGTAWLGLACYTLQIYFDFSGYSDMAIGLGSMFGFHLPENFNYPYISKSVTEFWRRWHISLSTWLRDYLFLPLSYSLLTDRARKKIASRSYNIPWATYFSILIVFSICGLWHGAGWNFVLWGLFQGVFLVLERLEIFKPFGKAWSPLKHCYFLFVVMIGWLFFRLASPAEVFHYLKIMFGLSTFAGASNPATVPVENDLLLAIGIGIVGATNIVPALTEYKMKLSKESGGMPATLFSRLFPALETAGLYLILFLSVMSLASGTYNPFIYFKF